MMSNPASVPEADGACHLVNTAAYSDGGDCKPAWKISPSVGLSCYLEKDALATHVNVWLQSRSLPARGRVGLEVHRCLCIIDAANVFISTVMG
jgi:hypothetical protein